MVGEGATSHVHVAVPDLLFAEIDRQAEDMLLRLVKEMAESEGVTEQLKAENQMEWVQKMNNIRNRAEEFVLKDFVYSINYLTTL